MDIINAINLFERLVTAATSSPGLDTAIANLIAKYRGKVAMTDPQIDNFIRLHIDNGDSLYRIDNLLKEHSEKVSNINRLSNKFSLFLFRDNVNNCRDYIRRRIEGRDPIETIENDMEQAVLRIQRNTLIEILVNKYSRNINMTVDELRRFINDNLNRNPSISGIFNIQTVLAGQPR